MENLPLLHSRVFEKAGYVQKKVFNKIPTPKNLISWWHNHPLLIIYGRSALWGS